MKKVILLLLFTCVSHPTFSQKDTISTKTIKGTVNKMIEIISGPIDEPRDWDEFRNLFLPNATTFLVNPKAKHPASKARSLTLEEFVRYIGPSYKKDGFKEVEIGLTINEFNNIANVFQAYYAENLKGTYKIKGINSFQLVKIDDRWWIASLTWDDETENKKIASIFLN